MELEFWKTKKTEEEKGTPKSLLKKETTGTSISSFKNLSPVWSDQTIELDTQVEEIFLRELHNSISILFYPPTLNLQYFLVFHVKHCMVLFLKFGLQI